MKQKKKKKRKKYHKLKLCQLVFIIFKQQIGRYVFEFRASKLRFYETIADWKFRNFEISRFCNSLENRQNRSGFQKQMRSNPF